MTTSLLRNGMEFTCCIKLYGEHSQTIARFVESGKFRQRLQEVLSMGSAYKHTIAHWYMFRVHVTGSLPLFTLTIRCTLRPVRDGFGPKGSAIQITSKTTDEVPAFTVKDVREHARSALHEQSYRGEWLRNSRMNTRIVKWIQVRPLY